MRPALIVVIMLYVAGVIALISYVVGHPPTGPEICGPVACQAKSGLHPSGAHVGRRLIASRAGSRRPPGRVPGGAA